MKSEKRKIHIIPDSSAMTVVGIVLLLFELGFLYLLLIVDVLPDRYLFAINAVLLLMGIIILVLLSSRRSTNLRYLGMISTTLVCIFSLMGFYYLANTNSTLSQITNIGAVMDTYDVVVRADSGFEDVSDIEGNNVLVINTDSKAYHKAQGKLKNKAAIEYDKVSSMADIEENLIGDSSNIHSNVAFVSDTQYDTYCEDSKSFASKTEILYKIKVKSSMNSDSASDLDVTEDPFNIYVSGMDVWGDINRVARSDVNMIITVNPQTRQVLLTSIPRDSYVALHQNGEMDKLTHTGIYGIDETLNTVEDWTGVHSDFYVRANFTMIRDLINAIGGIRVYSDFEFSSHLKDYHYVKGWNDMSGRAALYFARERKAFKNSDQQRVINQQRVVKAIIRKMTRSEVLLTNYTEILEAVSKYMQTNMSRSDMSALVKMQLDDMDTKWTLNSYAIGGYLTQRGTYSMGPRRALDVFITDEKSVTKAVSNINQVMYPEDDKPVKIKDTKSDKDNLKPTKPITYTDRDGNVIGHSDNK